MNKNEKSNKTNNKNILKQTYIYVNITFLCLSIYVFLYPVIANFIKIFAPNFGVCVFKQMTGQACPLCGGTRYIENLLMAFKDPSYLLNPFGIMIIVIIIEIISRILIFANINKIEKKGILKKVITVDVIWHSLIIFAFISYEILFFLL